MNWYITWHYHVLWHRKFLGLSCIFEDIDLIKLNTYKIFSMWHHGYFATAQHVQSYKLKSHGLCKSMQYRLLYTMTHSLIPKLQDKIWDWSGNEATLAHLAVWVFSISLFLDNTYSMIWLGDSAPLLATLNIIAVPFSLHEWLKLYNMAFIIVALS